MKALKIILITLTVFSGCAKKAGSVPATNTDTAKTQTMNAANPYTYLALGDSYTIGESVTQAQSYPYQLTALLNSYSIGVAAPTIIAATGWTTDNLIDVINQRAIRGKTYNFVTLLIGVNDQYQQLSIDNYKVKFAQVLNTAISFAKGNKSRVFVLSIPDWGVTPFGDGQDGVIGPQIDLFNAANKAISQAAGVNYLDITAISRNAATNPTLIASDGLHPSAAMYALWMQELEPMVAAQLKK